MSLMKRSCRRVVTAVMAAGVLGGTSGHAQSAAPDLPAASFEVASIKPARI